MQHNGWDHGLTVTDEGAGLVGHGGGVLLRKLADQCGLTAALEAALSRAGTSPQFSRGVVVVSVAVAIALGATSMSDIAVLAQLAPVLGAAPSGSTVRRALGLADARTLARIAQARARIRAHVWEQIEQTPAGFPWLRIAGKTLMGWLVIDMDATLITAYSDKEGAAPTWKKGYGLLTELRDVTAAQEAKPSPRPAAGVSERSRSPGRGSHVASLIATETGHTVLNHLPSFSSLPIFDVSRGDP